MHQKLIQNRDVAIFKFPDLDLFLKEEHQCISLEKKKKEKQETDTSTKCSFAILTS